MGKSELFILYEKLSTPNASFTEVDWRSRETLYLYFKFHNIKKKIFFKKKNTFDLFLEMNKWSIYF